MRQLIFCLLLLGISYGLKAQTEQPKLRIAVFGGLNQNGFWGTKPFLSKICREGCVPGEQTGTTTFLSDYRLIYELYPKHTFGIGFSQHIIEFVEKGGASIGGLELYPYEETNEFDYQTFYTTHGILLVNDDDFKVQLFTGIGLDIAQNKRTPLKSTALFYRGALGVDYYFFPKVGFGIEGFFKTGLTPYTSAFFDEQILMRPYSFGLIGGIKIGLF